MEDDKISVLHSAHYVKQSIIRRQNSKLCFRRGDYWISRTKHPLDEKKNLADALGDFLLYCS